MSSRNKVVVGLISLFLFTNITLVQASSIAGSKCTKINTVKIVSNVKYTCIKQSKKLVWNKGVAIKQTVISVPTPTPTVEKVIPVAAPEKSKLEIDFDKITALSNDSSLNVDHTTTIIASNEILPTTIEHIKNKYTYVYNFWSHYTNQLKNLKLIIATGDSVKWMSDQIDLIVGHTDDLFLQGNLNSVKQSPCQNFGAGSLFLITDIFVNTYRLFPSQCSTQEPTRPEYIGAPFHEFTHNMQTTFAGDARLLPCWMKEGQATFYENNLGNAGNFSEFLKVQSYWTTRTNKNVIVSTLKKLDINYGDGNCSRDGGYEYGYTAMQVLANQYGQDKGIDLLKEIKVTHDWKIAFKNIYGKSFDDWLRNSENELKSL